MLIEVDGCPASVVTDLKNRVENDLDFKHNLPALEIWPDNEGEDDLPSHPSLEELITDWFIFS